MEKKALGRGLEALLPGKIGEQQKSLSEAQHIPILQILPNRYQPRQAFPDEGLKRLADSVRRSGLLQPIVVRRVRDGEYELIAGERRFRAAKMANLATIPAIIRNSTDQQSAVFSLIENIQRQDLNPLEEARAYVRLMKEFHVTQEDIAAQVGKDRSSVANLARLVTLPRAVQELVESEQLTVGHAKVILGLDDPTAQERVAKQIVAQGLSVRAAETWVAARTRPYRNAKAPRVSPYHDLEERLRKRLGTKARIKPSRKGGQIEIRFFSEAELNRIVEVILE